MRTPECPGCRVRMEEGFIADRGHSVKGKARLPINAFR
jgi:hypothetical protein